MSVGRLLCVGLRGAEPGEPQLEQDLDACAEAGVGGVILFDVDVPTLNRLVAEGCDEAAARERAGRNILDPEQLRGLISHIRARLGPSVFVAIDQEGGQVARLSAARGFETDPAAREFADLAPSDRAQRAARQAQQLAALGIDLNFAPCVDVAIEAENAIISRLGRSYGSDPDEIIACARTVIDAHKAAGVAACLKHFPGHGSSRGDSHLGAVDITETWLREIELAPFRALCDQPGVAVMAAHVIHRELGGDRPASLAAPIMTDLLRRELGFDGVVVTDSIDMRAVADRFDPGSAAVAAVVAGADLVIDGFNLTERAEHPAPLLVDALGQAVMDGTIPGGIERINASLARLLRLRREIGAPV